jgi:hypothetical protein
MTNLTSTSTQTAPTPTVRVDAGASSPNSIGATEAIHATTELAGTGPLSEFLDRINSPWMQADGADLRLLFAMLSDADRPIAQQALARYRDELRAQLVRTVTSDPTANIDELRRRVARLNEVDTATDEQSTATPEASQASLLQFYEELTAFGQSTFDPSTLRAAFVAMRDEDRLQAVDALTAARRRESSRIAALERGSEDPVPSFEYSTLRSLADVDAPVGPQPELPDQGVAIAYPAAVAR